MILIVIVTINEVQLHHLHTKDMNEYDFKSWKSPMFASNFKDNLRVNLTEKTAFFFKNALINQFHKNIGVKFQFNSIQIEKRKLKITF